ncbi:MAG: hypothetical protein ACJAWV_001120 [Flammeovirgaceae bacterium]|jgi:hypothetical protein
MQKLENMGIKNWFGMRFQTISPIPHESFLTIAS